MEAVERGDKAAVLDAIAAGADVAAGAAGEIPEMARRYAAGEVSWRGIREQTAIAFGDLLLELVRQGLSLPKVTAGQTLQQARLWRDILRCAAGGRAPARDARRERRILRRYSAGKLPRRAAMAALGLSNYSQLLRRLRALRISRPAVPEAERQKMVEEMLDALRGA